MNGLDPTIAGFIAESPIVLFIGIAVLPAFGVPNCPLMLVGGCLVAREHGVSTAVTTAVAGVVANIVWSYWVAAYPMRSRLWPKMERVAPWFVKMENTSVAGVTLLLHVTPGVPLFVQTYYPGVHRLPYLLYLAIAVPIQSLYAAAIVCAGGAVARQLSLSMIIFVATVALIVVLLRSRSLNDRNMPHT